MYRWADNTKKAPQVEDLEGADGARGIRTPKPFRALAFEASAIPFCQRSPTRGLQFPSNRGARIRTGDLCDPNAALYRTEPRPGILGYLYSTTDGVGWSCGASHPRSSRVLPFWRFAVPCLAARVKPTLRSSSKISWVRTPVPFLSTQPRTGWDSNPRGREPTRFPIVRLKPLGHPSNEAVVRPVFTTFTAGVGLSCGRFAILAPLHSPRSFRAKPTLRSSLKSTWVEPH